MLLSVALASPVIGELQFEGNQHLADEQLRQMLRISKVGAHFNPAMLRMELRSLERALREEGFLKAKVGAPVVESKPENAESVVIRIPVQEGPPFVLGGIDIRAATVMPPPSLRQICPLKSGDRYSRRRLIDWQGRIADSYRSMGYLRFQTHLEESIDPLQHKVDVVLTCEEGSAYRVGKITVAGDESIDPEVFRRQLMVGEGLVYSPEMLGLTLQYLNRSGQYRPITHRDLQIQIHDDSLTVDITFRVFWAGKAAGSGKS